MNFENKINKLKAKVSDLENRLVDLETQRRLAILGDRNSEVREDIRKEHIDISFELLQVKDKVRELEGRRRELENNQIDEAKRREAKELQVVREDIFKRFSPAFKRIEKLRNSLGTV